MGNLPQLAEVGATESTLFDELLAQPFRGRQSEFERLLSQTPKSEFEKLLERDFLPKSASNIGEGARPTGLAKIITGAKWIGYVGEATAQLDVLLDIFGQVKARYENSDDYLAALRREFGPNGVNIAAAIKDLSDNDTSAMTDSLIEVNTMFKAEISCLKQTNKKRAYRMATGRKNG